MRWIGVVMSSLLMLAGCGEEVVVSSGGDGTCVSHYEPVVDAPTLRELKRELRQDVDDKVRTLRIIDEHPDEGKVYVNLLNRRHRIVMSLDMWKRADGTWTAERWLQCID